MTCAALACFAHPNRDSAPSQREPDSESLRPPQRRCTCTIALRTARQEKPIMPVHDWTRVEAGVFHDFHVGWIPEIRTALNGGLLPEGYYAMAEQHAGQTIADVLTLHSSRAPRPALELPLPPAPATGGLAVA